MTDKPISKNRAQETDSISKELMEIVEDTSENSSRFTVGRAKVMFEYPRYRIIDTDLLTQKLCSWAVRRDARLWNEFGERERSK